MPQSLAAMHVHLIYSTKNRVPMLIPEIRPRLFEYCGGIARNRKCVLLAANSIHALRKWRQQAFARRSSEKCIRKGCAR